MKRIATLILLTTLLSGCTASVGDWNSKDWWKQADRERGE